MAWPVIPSIPPHVQTGGLITSGWNNQHVDATAALWTDLQSITAASIGGVPATRQVIAGVGMTGGGDLSADRTFSVDFTRVVDRQGSYANPAWITSLSASKITPVAGSGVQTPWLQNIDGGNFQLANVSKIGIGTASPGYLLDVRGGGFNSQLHISADGSDTGGYFSHNIPASVFAMSYGAATNSSNQWIAKGPVSSQIWCYYNLITFYTNSGLTAGNQFTPTERLRIDSAGNVGIGTGSPQSALDVVGNLNIQNNGFGYTLQRNTFNGLLQFTGTQTNANGYDFQIAPNATPYVTGLRVSQWGSSMYVSMVPSIGNVLIGAAPQSAAGPYLLDIGGRSTGNSQMHISFDGTDTCGYLWADNRSGSCLAISAGIAVNGVWVAKATSWSLASFLNNTFAVYLGTGATVGAGVTLPTPTLYASGANVGIGTASPAFPLDIYTSGGTALHIATSVSNAVIQAPVNANRCEMEFLYATGTTGASVGVSSGQTLFPGAAGNFIVSMLASGTWTDRLTIINASGRVLVNATAIDGSGCQLQVTGGISNNGAVVAAPSDIRLKRDVEPYTAGLAAVLGVNPIRFAYNGKGGTTDGARWVSVDAQAHREFPDAVVRYQGELDGEPTELYNFQLQPLVMALVNAVKELAAKIRQLERGN